MRTKLLKFVLILLISGAPESLLAAHTVLVAGPDVRPLEIEAYAEAFGKRTLVEELDEQRPGLTWSRKLQSTLERAQRAWLSEAPEKASKAFTEVANLSLEADWKEPQRQALHYAHLRAAQGATTDKQRDEWLRKAATRFPDVRQDSSLFPPPLMAVYDKVLEGVRKESVEFDFGSYAQDSRILLINGRRFQIKTDLRVRLSRDKHRFTILSDSLETRSVVTSIEKVDDALSHREPLVSGTCDSATVIQGRVPSSIKPEVFLTPNCTQKTAPVTERALSQESGSSSVQSMSTDVTDHDVQMPLAPPLPQNSNGVSRTKWMWLGLGLTAVAVTSMYLAFGGEKTDSIDPQQREPTPTVYREGFN